MAELNLQILDAAFEDGFFSQPLSIRQRLYLSLSVGTAWDILLMIGDRSENGATVEAIAQNLQLNKNTVRQYCRWLRGKKLIQGSRNEGHGGLLVYRWSENKSRKS